MNLLRPALAPLLAVLLLPGCALLRKGQPLRVRYFAPELSANAARVTSAVSAAPYRVRLGRVSSGPHLGQRLTVRNSDVEVAYRDDMRWTERPEAFLRRDLAQALFEQRGLLNIVSGPGPVLDVELVAFEEVRGQTPKARFQVVLTLSTNRVQIVEQTITEEVLMSGEGPTVMISALTRALEQGVARIADATTAALASHTAALEASAPASSPEGLVGAR